MKLYHFTPAHMVEHILYDGLTKGQLPIIDERGYPVTFISPCQWLTKDKNWNNQSWATSNVITYDRTACRLKIIIPKTHRSKLIKAHDFLPQLPVSTRRLITDWPGSENWYLFLGRIPPGWIRKVEQRGGSVAGAS